MFEFYDRLTAEERAQLLGDLKDIDVQRVNQARSDAALRTVCAYRAAQVAPLSRHWWLNPLAEPFPGGFLTSCAQRH